MRPSWRKTAAILLLLASAAAGAAMSFSWSVREGPHGGYRVQTSAGDYIVVVEGDRVWVGTEDEYERGRINGMLRDNGWVEFKAYGMGSSQVSKGLPTTSVGTNRLASISTSVLFGVEADRKLRRPPKPANSEYVQIVWVQSEARRVFAKVYDSEAHVAFQANDCNEDGGFHYCEFTMPRSALSHRAVAMFASSSGKPGAVPMTSVAAEAYRTFADKYKSFNGQRMLDLSDEDRWDVKSLHEVDPTVPATLPK